MLGYGKDIACSVQYHSGGEDICDEYRQRFREQRVESVRSVIYKRAGLVATNMRTESGQPPIRVTKQLSLPDNSTAMSTTARRQASTTSLSKYARSAALPQNDRMLDFCNSFWGLGDGGVDVLFTRMRGAARTMDELKAFWRERFVFKHRRSSEIYSFSVFRALIEEEYSKRLTKLAKQALGKDEIGYGFTSPRGSTPEIDKCASSELRNSIDTLRLETDKQASSHSHLAQQLRTDLEGPVAEFVARQVQHRKTVSLPL